MKKKILCMFVCMLLSFTVLSAAESINHIKEDVRDVRVAIYTDTEQEGYFLKPLKDYNWKVGQTTYRFAPTILTTKDLLRGKLNTDSYDMFIYSFNQADQHLLGTSFSRLPKNKIIVKNIVDFVKDGGGYYGSCGSAAVAGGMTNKPKSFLERAMNKSSLGISAVELEYDTAIPILMEFRGKGPETVDMQAYLFYSGWHNPNPHDRNYSGVCPDVNISKDNPIFDDYVGDARKIRWIGMSAFEVPEQPDREINVLARFPEEELSDNVSAQIHYWTYTGGLRGLIKGLFVKADIIWCENLGVIMNSFIFSGDWEKTDTIVETKVANKAFMTSELYPNENKARIVRCSGHPELLTWWGGHLQDVEDTDKNNIYDGFHTLEDAIPLDQTVEDESTYNYCIVRSIVSWAAKVPDNDLPPIYGPSQVSDIYPYNQPSAFTVIGNAKEETERVMSLDLYYRHSSDNSSWSDWTLYEADSDSSNGWSWVFNTPAGEGYYQFYSIRHVEFDGYVETETAPPGPDAIAYAD